MQPITIYLSAHGLYIHTERDSTPHRLLHVWPILPKEIPTNVVKIYGCDQFLVFGQNHSRNENEKIFNNNGHAVNGARAKWANCIIWS